MYVLHAVPREFKSSLHNERGLAGPAALLVQHIMSLRGADDDLCAIDVARTSIPT